MKIGYSFEDLGGTTSGQAFQGKGLTRLWYMIIDNTGRFLAANAISILCMVPAALGMSFGVIFRQPWALLLSGLISGALLGPATGCLTDAILAALRGESGRWWQRYRRVCKRDWKNCMLPGIAVGIAAAMIINVLEQWRTNSHLPNLMLVSVLLSVVVLFLIGTYFWPMRMMLDLTMVQCIRNSLLMVIMHPAVSLIALALQLIYWGLMLFLLPYSLLLVVIFGVWFPTALVLNLIYDVFNKELRLEERLDQLYDQTDDEE